MTRRFETSEHSVDVLAVRRLPARLTRAQLAVLLGMHQDHVTWLIAEKLIRPLGKPGIGAAMYFSTVEVLGLSSSRAWLDKATLVVAKRIRKKNSREQHERSNS